MSAITDHLWQSTTVALLGALLTTVFRRNGAGVRYWIWFAALMKFAVPFALVAPIAGWLVPPLPSSVADTAGVAAATALFRSSTLLAPAAALSALWRGRPVVPLAPLAPLAPLIWFSGVAMVLSTWLLRWRRVAASVRSATPVVDGPVHDALLRMTAKAHLRASVRLVLSNRNVEPGVFGLWHPTLVWPCRLTASVTPEQLDAIIAHELFHVVRRDNLLACAQTIVCASFWFHPLVWWLGARLVEERERACDEHVVATGQRRAAYAEGILETCRLCLASPLAAVSGVTGGDLKKRVVRIMSGEPALKLGLRKRLLLVMAGLLLFVAPIASGRSAARPDDGSNQVTLAVQAGDQEEVHRPGGDVSTPRLLREVKPQYSERAKAEKIEGEVTMECVVKADGTVGRIDVTRPLDPELDEAAVHALSQWRFEPGRRNGKPVNVLVTVQMMFTLK